MLRKLIVLTLIFVSFTSAYSQSSIDSSTVIYGWKLDDNYVMPIKTDIDTNLVNFQLHNVPFRKYHSLTTLGSNGSPYLQNSFFQRHDKEDLLFLSSYKDYLHTYENTTYINTRKPFTHLQWSQSWPKSNREETLKVTHSQNVNNRLNLGFDLDFISDKAQYKYLNVSQKAFKLFGSYNGRVYSMHTSLNMNRYYSGENGGLVDSTYIAEEPFTKDYDTYFTGGGNTGSQPYQPHVTNKIRYIDGMLSQNVKLLGNRPYDSTRSSIAQPIISHVLKVRRASKIYENTNKANNSYYQNNFTNSSETYDSVAEYRVSNTIQLDFKTKINNKILAGVYANINYDYIKNSYYSLLDSNLIDSSLVGIIEVPTIDQGDYYANKVIYGKRGIKNYDTVYDINNQTKYSNLYISGGIYGKFWTHFESRFNGLIYLAGYRAGQTRLDGVINTNVKILKKPYQFYLKGAFENVKPAYQYNNYYSNHYIWENEYGYINNLLLSSKLAAPSNGFELAWDYNLISNYIYMTDSMPVVNSNPISISALTVQKEFILWKFHSFNKLTYQVSEDRSVVEIPTVLFFNSTYIDHTWLFKLTDGRLRTMLGVDIYYSTEFNGYDYIPALSQFYQPNSVEGQSSFKVGNYPYIDVWVNIRLKRTRFFFKYEHVNRSTDNIDHFYAINYPSKVSTLKFGLSWTFYD